MQESINIVTPEEYKNKLYSILKIGASYLSEDPEQVKKYKKIIEDYNKMVQKKYDSGSTEPILKFDIDHLENNLIGIKSYALYENPDFQYVVKKIYGVKLNKDNLMEVTKLLREIKEKDMEDMISNPGTKRPYDELYNNFIPILASIKGLFYEDISNLVNCDESDLENQINTISSTVDEKLLNKDSDEKIAIELNTKINELISMNDFKVLTKEEKSFCLSYGLNVDSAIFNFNNTILEEYYVKKDEKFGPIFKKMSGVELTQDIINLGKEVFKSYNKIKQEYKKPDHGNLGKYSDLDKQIGNAEEEIERVFYRKGFNASDISYIKKQEVLDVNKLKDKIVANKRLNSILGNFDETLGLQKLSTDDKTILSNMGGVKCSFSKATEIPKSFANIAKSLPSIRLKGKRYYDIALKATPRITALNLKNVITNYKDLMELRLEIEVGKYGDLPKSELNLITLEDGSKVPQPGSILDHINSKIDILHANGFTEAALINLVNLDYENKLTDEVIASEMEKANANFKESEIKAADAYALENVEKDTEQIVKRTFEALNIGEVNLNKEEKAILEKFNQENENMFSNEKLVSNIMHIKFFTEKLQSNLENVDVFIKLFGEKNTEKEINKIISDLKEFKYKNDLIADPKLNKRYTRAFKNAITNMTVKCLLEEDIRELIDLDSNSKEYKDKLAEVIKGSNELMDLNVKQFKLNRDFYKDFTKVVQDLNATLPLYSESDIKKLRKLNIDASARNLNVDYIRTVHGDKIADIVSKRNGFYLEEEDFNHFASKLQEYYKNSKVEDGFFETKILFENAFNEIKDYFSNKGLTEADINYLKKQPIDDYTYQDVRQKVYVNNKIDMNKQLVNSKVEKLISSKKPNKQDVIEVINLLKENSDIASDISLKVYGKMAVNDNKAICQNVKTNLENIKTSLFTNPKIEAFMQDEDVKKMYDELTEVTNKLAVEKVNVEFDRSILQMDTLIDNVPNDMNNQVEEIIEKENILENEDMIFKK